MAKGKGEKYECPECGMVVIVEDVCGCDECDVVCCGVPMELKKEKPKKASAKVAAKKPKAQVKPAKKKPAK